MKLTPILAMSLFLLFPLAAAAQAPGAHSPEAAYSAGTQAMNQQRWPDAIHDFEQVIGSNSRHADAALYWKAYSLNQLSRGGDTRSTCEVLHVRFPGSSWNQDCAALTLGQIANRGRGTVSKVTQPHGATPPEAASDNDDLKLLALNSIAARDPARAAPLLRQMLTSNSSQAIRGQAIFALTQSRAPEMEAVLRDVLTGKLGPGLQAMAIPEVGALAGPRWNDQFVNIYSSSTDPAVKRATVSALFVSGDATHLIDLARGETNPEWKRTIVSELALMNNKAAQDYMLELLK